MVNFNNIFGLKQYDTPNHNLNNIHDYLFKVGCTNFGKNLGHALNAQGA